MKFGLLLLRLLPPEISHFVALNILNFLYKLNLLNFFFPYDDFGESFEFRGLTFKNKLGIAAGLDKNGDFIDSLGALGFGFIEVGTVTPLKQYGNQKPRVFRLENDKALINRLGFNNSGSDSVSDRIKKINRLVYLV